MRAKTVLREPKENPDQKDHPAKMVGPVKKEDPVRLSSSILQGNRTPVHLVRTEVPVQPVKTDPKEMMEHPDQPVPKVVLDQSVAPERMANQDQKVHREKTARAVNPVSVQNIAPKTEASFSKTEHVDKFLWLTILISQKIRCPKLLFR
jgi:hypothetical protein